MRIKNICTCFLLFSLCFLELSCILQNLVVVYIAHNMKRTVSTFLFSCKMLRSLVFWYCSSFFCPLDLSGPWCHRCLRKFIFLRYTPSKIELTGHDGGRNTRNSTTNRILAERDSVFCVLSPARHHFLVDC